MTEPNMQARNEYVEFWNDTLADKFERFREVLMDGLSYHSRVPLESLALEPGSRVVDVGCGWGDTAIELARKTGADGFVLGLDCVDRFLEKGRHDAKAAGIRNIQFVDADVQTFSFRGDFDFCFSRFGMMFFENPVAAMKNIRRSLKPGGEVMFIVWRTIDDNDWMRVPKQVVLDFLPPPGEDARSCGPGPFSMADSDTVSKQMEIAGFADIHFERIDGPVTVGRTAEDAMQFQLALGPAGEVFREAGEEAERQTEEIQRALRDAIAPYEKDGAIVMPSSSWTITARNPG